MVSASEKTGTIKKAMLYRRVSWRWNSVTLGIVSLNPNPDAEMHG